MYSIKQEVTALPLVGDKAGLKLKKLGIKTIEDLLFHTPRRYEDAGDTLGISEVKPGEKVTIKASPLEIKSIYTKTGKVLIEGLFSDGSSQIGAIWFNQTYLTRVFSSNELFLLSGKVGLWKKKPALISPNYEKVIEGSLPVHIGASTPIYPETAGVSSKWLRRVVNIALGKTDLKALEFLPEDILTKYNLIEISEAINLIHRPKSGSDVTRSRERLAFNELLLAQVSSLERKKKWRQNHKAVKMNIGEDQYNDFLTSLPFTPTASQKVAIDDLTADLASTIPANRLLEGDVGSGKTTVAAYGAYLTYLNKGKTAILAPTQVLANQHFKVIGELLSKWGVKTELVTGSHKKTDSSCDVFVGTHALLGRKGLPEFQFVVIDEQHRFGVEQRAKISEGGGAIPHTLTMTATPIPRTIALTLYGDLELTVLKDLPHGARKVKTWIVEKNKREASYEWVKKMISETGGQAFVVCPFIEESEKDNLSEIKSAKEEYEKLSKIFKNHKLSILHGKMKQSEKDEVLSEFKDKKSDILICTPVVEVGIDIPNANIMLIESPERFGLAALHQLRGRVGRAGQDSYCLLMFEVNSSKAKERLTHLTHSHSGIELAEIDLALRGPGEVFGSRQSGLPEFKYASWGDTELIKRSKELALNMVENPAAYSQAIAYFKSKEISEN
jgi:ATP-dependent DNA helicase RecG